MATARDAAASTDRIAAALEARREHHVNTPTTASGGASPSGPAATCAGRPTSSAG